MTFDIQYRAAHTPYGSAFHVGFLSISLSCCTFWLCFLIHLACSGSINHTSHTIRAAAHQHTHTQRTQVSTGRREKQYKQLASLTCRQPASTEHSCVTTTLFYTQVPTELMVFLKTCVRYLEHVQLEETVQTSQKDEMLLLPSHFTMI